MKRSIILYGCALFAFSSTAFAEDSGYFIAGPSIMAIDNEVAPGATMSIGYKAEYAYIGYRMALYGDSSGYFSYYDLDMGARLGIGNSKFKVGPLFGLGVGLGTFFLNTDPSFLAVVHLPAYLGVFVDIKRFTFDMFAGPTLIWAGHSPVGFFNGTLEIGAHF